MPAKNEPPPIVSADGKPLKKGMKIYYTQQCCNSDNPYLVKTGTIADLDLGAKREVRVRKAEGREVVLSMSERHGLCKPEGLNEPLLFTTKSGASAKAIELSQPGLSELMEQAEEYEQDAKTYLAENIAALKEQTNWKKAKRAKKTKDIEEYEKKLSALKKAVK